MKNRRSLKVGLALLPLLALYCLAGYLMMIDFSASPGYPRERAARGALLWGIGALLSATGFTVCLVLFVIDKRKMK